MSDFKQAIKWLKDGKKVRRKNFGKPRYLHLTVGSVIELDVLGVYPFKIHDLEADDWEIYEEEKDGQVKFNPGGKVYRMWIPKEAAEVRRQYLN